jgi:glutathione synthase/RimK-type ligase-like ATP-grasp enzyme
LEARYVTLNQREVRDMRLRVNADAPASGTLTLPRQEIDLESVTGVYLRLMDDRVLPEVLAEPEDSPVRASSRAFHDLLGAWGDLCDARVVNRYQAMGSNFSKPFQAQLIAAHGFEVAETLITNVPEQVLAFREQHGRIIYKSISGERSIVNLLRDDDSRRLERIAWCPVQFQAYVEGDDVRVHTVGSKVFATLVQSDAVDYRYALQQTGNTATFTPYELPSDHAQRCVALAASLGLEVAGLDFKLTEDGRMVCLEVNPSPVFSYYELHDGQPIAAAVATHLVEAGEPVRSCTVGSQTLRVSAA